MNAEKLPVWQMSVDEVKALIETNRQQADRIAELEKDLHMIERHYERLCTQKKQSEPVAWAYYDDWNNLKLAQTMPPDPNMFPLYTTPQTKRLSDEEIKQIWNDNLAIMGNDLQPARAIEAKVRGEK